MRVYNAIKNGLVAALLSLPLQALETKSLADLKGIDRAALAGAGYIKPDTMLTYGAVIDGVHY